MYSPRIVGSTIERYIASGRPKPEYHTISDCERGVAHLNSLMEYDSESDSMVPKRDKSKRLGETLTRDEVVWIQNERFLCRSDFNYFVSRYGWIKDEEDVPTKITLWSSQEIFMDIVGDLQEMEIAIFLIVLKARQLGISRIVSLIILHRIIFFSNINAFMASSTSDKTRLLFDMSDFVVARLPWWMQPENYPQCKARREGQFWEFFSGSAVTLQHGQQTTGIARGTTPTMAHLSEISEFDEENVSDLIDSSLLRAMHPSVRSFLALESTAKGINNYWHKKWRTAKSEWPEQRGRLCPLFLPWFVGGLYPKPVDLRARPVPLDYSTTMRPWAWNHAQMAAEYVKSSPALTKHLGSNWHMPIEQIWYYECERESAIRENRLGKFLSEMPANDDEAFQSTNTSVFDAEVLTYYRDNAHRQPLVGCYGLRGPSEYVPARLQPSSLIIDPNQPIVPVNVTCGTGFPIPFELVPVRFDGWSLESDDDSESINKIYLWEKPMPGELYGFGADTGDGVDRDRSVLEIFKKGNVHHSGKQVGELASGKMNALDLTPFALTLGTYFSVPDENGDIKQPRMAIECRGTGDQMQLRMKMHGWRNFHIWNDRQIDDRKPNFNKAHKIGVFTNEWFRTGMLEMLTKMLRDAEIEICSPHLVKEMASLEADDYHQSLRAGYGGHDDRIMALGFIVISLYRFDVTFSQSAHIKAYSGQKNPMIANRPRQYAKWALSAQERS